MKPYTAITVTVDRLCNCDAEDEIYGELPSLTESIRLQSAGPTEAARAIRKKLKYGNMHRQLLALSILAALVANGGRRFQQSFADEPLLERLRILATDPHIHADVRSKTRALFAQWAQEFANVPGMAQVASLHKQVPQKRPQPRVRSPSPEGAAASSSNPSITPRESLREPSSPPQQHRRRGSSVNAQPTLSIKVEKPKMLQCLAESSAAATNLTNALQHLNRETELPSENGKVAEHYKACRGLRRLVLRYIQGVESDEWLGALIHANEELVNALLLYDKLSKPLDEDSDSDVGSADSGEVPVRVHRPPIPDPKPNPGPEPAVTPPQPPRLQDVEPDPDPNDPFADTNAAATPRVERKEWP